VKENTSVEKNSNVPAGAVSVTWTICSWNDSTCFDTDTTDLFGLTLPTDVKSIMALWEALATQPTPRGLQ